MNQLQQGTGRSHRETDRRFPGLYSISKNISKSPMVPDQTYDIYELYVQQIVGCNPKTI